MTCGHRSLAAGASTRFRVIAHLASSLTTGVVNTAHVSSATLDPDPSNNYSTVSTPIGRLADLALSKTSSPGRVPGALAGTPGSLTTVPPGGLVSYTLVATNHGPSDARNVTVSDPLHAGLALVSATASQGSCKPGPDLLCSLGTCKPGAARRSC